MPSGENLRRGYVNPKTGKPDRRDFGSAVGTQWQCTHVYKYSEKRCGHWVVKGEIYCPYHLRRHQGRRTTVKLYRLPRFYSKVLTSTLRDYVAECCEAQPHEQLALWEELALQRDYASQFVALYALLKERLAQSGTAEERLANLERLSKVGDMMQEQFKNIAELCTKQSNIMNAGKDKITVHNIEFAIRQVTRLAYDAFGEDPRVVEFERLIKENVKVQAGPEGTGITPDQEALAMDSLVPEVPDNVDKVA